MGTYRIDLPDAYQSAVETSREGEQDTNFVAA